mmetsp:Transcript_71684/g.171200  ORF Transcript_71684/g.171200 Transcript_71684/m.171200 type:complete len:250 (+) Transcript_71684:809-1558(+)
MREDISSITVAGCAKPLATLLRHLKRLHCFEAFRKFPSRTQSHSFLCSSGISSFACFAPETKCKVAASGGLVISMPLYASSRAQDSARDGDSARLCEAFMASSKRLIMYFTSPTTSYKARYLALILRHMASGSNLITGRICRPARLQSNRVSSWFPMEITSWAVSMIRVAFSSPDLPCTPMTPNAKGWDSSTQPFASSRVSTGALRRSASCRISSPASTARCPTAITTRPLPRSTAALSSEATLRMRYE